MKKLLIVVFAASFLTVTAQAQHEIIPESRTFRISSIGTAFGVQTQVDGEYVVEADRIRLRITKAEILVSDHCPYKGRRQLSKLRIDLATRVEGRSWKSNHKGQSFPLNNVMGPGDKFEFNEVYLDIPLDAATDLSKHWLVLLIEEVSLDLPDLQDRKGYSFAHSACDIFGQAAYEAKAVEKRTAARKCV